jgi:hypothetical protein
MTPLIVYRCRLLEGRRDRVNECNGDFSSISQPVPSNALLRANSDSQAHNVRMSQKRTKADKAQREADLLDKRSSHRPPQKQGKKPREDFNQAAVRIVEEAAEKH